MVALLFFVLVIYAGSYKTIREKEWGKTVQIVIASFIIALVLTYCISGPLISLLKKIQ